MIWWSQWKLLITDIWPHKKFLSLVFNIERLMPPLFLLANFWILKQKQQTFKKRKKWDILELPGFKSRVGPMD